MTQYDSPVPLYVQIKDYIRLNIQNGIYRADEKIPSSRQFADQFSVNRLTVTKAIKELVQEGLLYSQVGKGTYVAPAKIDQMLQTLTSFTQDMSRRGKNVSSKVLYANVDPASDEVARALAILRGAEVVVLHRVRLADGQIIALEKSHIIYALCPNILDHHDFCRDSLYHVLRTDYNLHLTYARQTIEAKIADENELELLEAERNTPVLSITRVTYDTKDRPVEYVRSAYRGDRYSFYTVLRTLD